MSVPTTDQPAAPEPEPEPVTIRYEQAVYGSFAFRPDGYAMLANSPRCREEWLADFRAACQRIGEQPTGVPDRPSVFATRLVSGPWCVVGVFPQGSDDKGRPGALAFHGLFLTGRDYRALGASPFPLRGVLRGDWPENLALDSGVSSVVPETAAIAGSPDDLAGRIAKVLRRGWKAALESPEPGDELARAVWRRLPRKPRTRLTVGTWAFGNGNGFDLLIGPKLAGVVLDPVTIRIEPNSPSAEEIALHSRSFFQAHRLIAAGFVGVALTLTAAAVGLALQFRDEPEEPAVPPTVRPMIVASRAEPSREPLGEMEEDVSPVERQGLIEALVHATDRFDVLRGEFLNNEDEADPGALMEQLAAKLRYAGPFLSDNDRQALQRDPGHDAELALRWEEHVRKFAPDRPLPADFRSKGPRSQVALLAWTFHCDARSRDRSRLSPAERVQALAETLAVDVALRPTPMVEHYPALASYLAFLGRLPRR